MSRHSAGKSLLVDARLTPPESRTFAADLTGRLQFYCHVLVDNFSFLELRLYCYVIITWATPTQGFLEAN